MRRRWRAMDSARLRSMAIVAVVLLLALGGLFLARGRSGPGEGGRQAGRAEPTVTLVFENGRRESMPMEQYVKGVVAEGKGLLPRRGATEVGGLSVAGCSPQGTMALIIPVPVLRGA